MTIPDPKNRRMTGYVKVCELCGADITWFPGLRCERCERGS